MGSNREGALPSYVCPLEGNDDAFTLPVWPSEADEFRGNSHDSHGASANLASFPFMSLSVPPLDNMHRDYQSYACDRNWMDDSIKISSQQNLQIDQNSTNIRSNMSRLRVPDSLCAEANKRDTQQLMNRVNVVTADNTINDGGCFSFQNPQSNSNFIPMRVDAAGDWELSRQGGKARNSDVIWPEINRNFVRQEFSTPRSYHRQSNREVDANNDDRVSSVHCNTPEKVDGSFLTLGIGVDTESRSKSDFCSQRIASKLEEALSPRFKASHVQLTNRNSSSLGLNLAGGFSNPTCNVGESTTFRRDVGLMQGADSGTGLSPLHTLKVPQPQGDGLHKYSVHGNRSSGFIGQKEARFAGSDAIRDSQGYQGPALFPFSSPPAGSFLPEKTGSSMLASESAKPTWVNVRPNSTHLQNCNMKTAKNFLPPFSMNSPYPWPRSSPSMHHHSGQLIPALPGCSTQAAGSGQFSIETGAKPVGQLFSGKEVNAAHAARASQFPKRARSQVDEGCSAEAAANGPFPKRLGLQFSDNSSAQVGGGGVLLERMGSQTNSNVAGTQGSGSVQFARSVHGPPFSAGFQEMARAKFCPNLLRPRSATGHVVPVAKAHGLPQTSTVLGRPSLRSLPPSAPHWYQQRKITPQLIFHPPPPTAAFPSSMPPPIAHIKWKGFEGHPQPVGHQCLLCKRDLSFTPEGPVSQPRVPPPSAVLPCGHTFHDHCLQRITPKDQSKYPPCIPCVIGET